MRKMYEENWEDGGEEADAGEQRHWPASRQLATQQNKDVITATPAIEFADVAGSLVGCVI